MFKLKIFNTNFLLAITGIPSLNNTQNNSNNKENTFTYKLYPSVNIK